MNTSAYKSLPYRLFAALLCVTAITLSGTPARAQVNHEVVQPGYDVVEPAADYEFRTDAELEDLVGPIALYPDDLVSIILAAATYPVQVVQAARYLEDRETDPGLEPAGDWDDAIVALLNYPEVIALLNDDLDWTWELGDAFLNQQAAVMDAVAQFRDRAYAAGNLRSDDRQVVRRVNRVIEIEPADPEVIYVPYYEPARVVVYQPYPVYFYHPRPRYAYYYPYPANYHFRYGLFFGVTTVYRLHWHSHSLYTYGFGYRGHPYFGHSYHRGHYFRYRPHYPRGRRAARSRGGYRDGFHPGDEWRPRPRHGARPGSGHRRAPGHRTLPGDTTPRLTHQGGGRRTAQAIRQPANERRMNGNRRVFTDRDPDMREAMRRARSARAGRHTATVSPSRDAVRVGSGTARTIRPPAADTARPHTAGRRPTRVAAGRLAGEGAENPRAGTRVRASRPAAAKSGATSVNRRIAAATRSGTGRTATRQSLPRAGATPSRAHVITRSPRPAQRPAVRPGRSVPTPAARQSPRPHVTPPPAPARKQHPPARSAAAPPKRSHGAGRTRDRRR